MSKPNKICPCVDLVYLSISIFLFLFLSLDLSLTTGLFITHYIREVDLYQVSLFERYSLGSGCVDVWITSLIKIAIFGAILFTLCVKKEVSFHRVRNVKNFLYSLILVLDLWLFAKLLASLEFYSDGTVILNNTLGNNTNNNNNKSTLHPILWTLLCWNVVTDIVYFCVLYCIIHLKTDQVGFKRRYKLKRFVDINDSSLGDNAPLLAEEPIEESVNDSEEKKSDEDENATGKLKGGLECNICR